MNSPNQPKASSEPREANTDAAAASPTAVPRAPLKTPPSSRNRDGDDRWEAMLEGLLDYQRKYNSLTVPRDYKWNNKNLYEWCRNNRKHYLNGVRGKTPALLPRRIQRLREIGFELDPTGAQGQNDAFDDKRWVVMFEGLVEFRRLYGSFAVPIGYMCDGRSLHDWLRHQRKQYCTLVDDGSRSALSAARIDRLLSIGCDLDPTGRRQDHRSDQERWEVMFQGLRDFHRRNGTFVVPDGTMHDNRNLASWAHNQRRLYANNLRNQQPMLLPERAARLQSIGFVLDPRAPNINQEAKKRGRKRSHGEYSSTGLMPLESTAANSYDHRRRLTFAQMLPSDSALRVPGHYTFTVTTDRERQAVSPAAVSLAKQALALYRSMSEQERSSLLDQEPACSSSSKSSTAEE